MKNSIISVRDKFAFEIIQLSQCIAEFESSNNQELIIACSTLKDQKAFKKIVLDALEKQIPKKAIMTHYEQFICPTCNCEDYTYYFKKMNACPNCGQLLEVEAERREDNGKQNKSTS